MILGTDESMPNVIPDEPALAPREPDLSSDQRDDALRDARLVLGWDYQQAIAKYGRSAADMLILLAQAVLRYVPAGVPPATPHLVAKATDQTMPAGKVLGVVEEELDDLSSGVCEVSDDASTSAVRYGSTITGYIDLNDDTRRG